MKNTLYSVNPILISALGLTAFIGFLVEKTKHHVIYIIAGQSLVSFGFYRLLKVPNCDENSCLISSIIIGIGSAIAGGTLWPILGFNVDKSKSASAYGIATSCQNLGYIILPLLNGWLMDNSTSKSSAYDNILSYYFYITVTSVVLSFGLLIAAGVNGGPYNK